MVTMLDVWTVGVFVSPALEEIQTMSADQVKQVGFIRLQVAVLL